MTDRARIKIAAIVTALFLAGICAAGLAVRDGQPQAAATAPAASTAPDAAAGESTSGYSSVRPTRPDELAMPYARTMYCLPPAM